MSKIIHGRRPSEQLVNRRDKITNKIGVVSFALAFACNGRADEIK